MTEVGVPGKIGAVMPVQDASVTVFEMVEEVPEYSAGPDWAPERVV